MFDVYQQIITKMSPECWAVFLEERGSKDAAAVQIVASHTLAEHNKLAVRCREADRTGCKVDKKVLTRFTTATGAERIGTNNTDLRHISLPLSFSAC